MTKEKLTLEDEIVELRRQVDELSAAVAAIRSPQHGKKTIKGDNVFVDSSTVLVSGENATICLGDHTKVWRGGEWTGPVTVGKRVFVNQGSYIRPLVTIEDDVSLGPFVRLITDTHEIGHKTRRTGTPKKTRLGSARALGSVPGQL